MNKATTDKKIAKAALNTPASQPVEVNKRLIQDILTDIMDSTEGQSVETVMQLRENLDQFMTLLVARAEIENQVTSFLPVK